MSKRSKERCGRYPAPGLTTCHIHGSATAKSKAAAERRIDAERAAVERLAQEERAAAAIRRALDDVEAKPITDPIPELMELAGRIKNATVKIGDRVNDLEGHIRYSASGSGTEQLRAEVALWERLIGRLHQVLVDMAKLNLEERMVRLNERQGDLVVQALTRIFNSLELNDHQRAKIPVVVPRELRLIGGGGQ